MQAPTDLAVLEELSRRAAAGDRDAFRRWVEATTPLLYRLALRVTGSAPEAEEVVQETHIRAWRALGELRDHRASLAWVSRIARGVAVDRRRAGARRPAEPLDDVDPAHLRGLAESRPDAPAADEQLAGEETRRAVRRALAELPEKHRVVLLLREADGLTSPEIAAALGIPLGTVESRIHRARRALRDRLERQGRRRSWLPW